MSSRGQVRRARRARPLVVLADRAPQPPTRTAGDARAAADEQPAHRFRAPRARSCSHSHCEELALRLMSFVATRSERARHAAGTPGVCSLRAGARPTRRETTSDPPMIRSMWSPASARGRSWSPGPAQMPGLMRRQQHDR
jgi:hypothetical protein